MWVESIVCNISVVFLGHSVLIDFRQTFVTGASWDTDDLITFLGQKVKVQGQTIAAEAHSTRRYGRVQLFLVCLYYLWYHRHSVRCPRLEISYPQDSSVIYGELMRHNVFFIFNFLIH